MQKAFKWLDAEKTKYSFHNYKEAGIEATTIENWLKYLPLEKVVNSKSTIFRSLSEKEKADTKIPKKAIQLMINNPSLIKRPIVDLGKNKFLIGFNITEFEAIKKAV